MAETMITYTLNFCGSSFWYVAAYPFLFVLFDRCRFYFFTFHSCQELSYLSKEKSGWKKKSVLRKL